MRILQATLASLFVCTVVFFTVKFWGLSQPYSDYKHPFYDTIETVYFKKPAFARVDEVLTKTNDNIYLDVANTKDQKVVIVATNADQSLDHTKDVRNKLYADVEKDVLLLRNYKDQLQKRKIIFNIVENAIAGHEIFVDEIKALGLEKGENFIVTTPYEVLAKSIKELQPTFLYGTSQPEILKLKAMESLGLIEAATIRADVLIYPLTYYKQPFYTETLQAELKRRFKKIIIGPISVSTSDAALVEQVEAAKALNPFGIILAD